MPWICAPVSMPKRTMNGIRSADMKSLKLYIITIIDDTETAPPLRPKHRVSVIKQQKETRVNKIRT